MQDSKQILVQRFFDELCNGRKLNAADELVAAGHIYHDPSSPWAGQGPEGVKQVIATYHNAFPDAHWRVHEVLTSGDTAVARWTGSGTHLGDLPGLPPTGRRVEVAGIWMFRIAGNQITESWDCWDFYGMMAQLGAVPALAGTTARAAG